MRRSGDRLFIRAGRFAFLSMKLVVLRRMPAMIRCRSTLLPRRNPDGGAEDTRQCLRSPSSIPVVVASSSVSGSANIESSLWLSSSSVLASENSALRGGGGNRRGRGSS